MADKIIGTEETPFTGLRLHNNGDDTYAMQSYGSATTTVQTTVTTALCTALKSTTPPAATLVAGYNGAQIVEAVAVGTVAAQAVTFKLQGSFDNTNWYDAGYQQIDATASPARAVAAITLTPGNGTSRAVYQILDAYPYLRVNPSANTLGTGLTCSLYAVPA